MENTDLSRREVLAIAGGAAAVAALSPGSGEAADKPAPAGSTGGDIPADSKKPLKVQVVYDKEGKIIWMGIVIQPASAKGPRPRMRAVGDAKRGVQVADFEVPPEHAKLGLKALGERLSVDVRTNRLVFKK